jgi:DNA-binding XRE family transcriptional regulator
MEGNMDTKRDINNTLASNIKFLRINTKVEEPITGKIKYMSQRQLAEFIGSITQQVSKFELGKNELGASQLYKIAKIFEVPVDKLFDAELLKSVYKKTIKQDIYT